ncbi:Ras-related protein Rap-1b [Histomonas meleagridis]|uniref:Ras-related protein Rap-1b n=1 Tax=Histomonas meleagridis TaxID=135588 RepID=UPI0035598471|nr:Ras-related protein Rap-1b [Histomonas meleagridis]KAH0805251.1 Ras-related protein Rap-1b [Histomonas meleagridis]
MSAEEWKIGVFGSFATGRSKIIEVFVQGTISTGGEDIMDSYKKKMQINDKTITLEIFDSVPNKIYLPEESPKESKTFNGLDNLCCLHWIKSAKGFIIIYSIDDRETFNNVKDFYKVITKTKGRTKIPLVICGNKCDLEDKREVYKEEGENLAMSLGAIFFETSVFRNIHIDDAFNALVNEMMNDPTISEDLSPTKTKHKVKCNIY